GTGPVDLSGGDGAGRAPVVAAGAVRGGGCRARAAGRCHWALWSGFARAGRRWNRGTFGRGSAGDAGRWPTRWPESAMSIGHLKQMSSVKLALLARQQRDNGAEAHAQRSEPIAIIGIAGRFAAEPVTSGHYW